MANKSTKPSGKVNIINSLTFDTYTEALKCNAISNVSNKVIHNAKFRKTTRKHFNVLEFLTHRPKQTRSKCAVAKFKIFGNVSIKKWKGKQREGGRKKHLTRLKKQILRCRQHKKNEMLNSSEEQTPQQNSMEYEVKDDKSTIEQPKNLTLPSGVHSRKFRDYCDNCTTPLLSSLTQSLLSDLNRFQTRAYSTNQIKARAHRRFVLGFREVQSYIQIGKVKLLCIATDLDTCAGEAGLDLIIANLKSQCEIGQIPYFFSLRRRQIAYALYKKVPISCVGIMDFDGARDTVAQLLDELAKARESYKELVTKKQSEQQNDVSALFQNKCSLYS